MQEFKMKHPKPIKKFELKLKYNPKDNQIILSGFKNKEQVSWFIKMIETDFQ